MEILTITKREIIVLISLNHLHSRPLWPSKSEPILLGDCLAILTFDTMANPLLVAEHCMWPIWAMVRIIVTNKIIVSKKKKKSGIFTNLINPFRDIIRKNIIKKKHLLRLFLISPICIPIFVKFTVIFNFDMFWKQYNIIWKNIISGKYDNTTIIF